MNLQKETCPFARDYVCSALQRWSQAYVMASSACLAVVRFKSSVGRWLWLGLLLFLFGTQITAADLAMSWDNGHLETTGKVSQSASKIIDLINDQRFDDALEQIENLELDDTDRGHLALAVAGHLDMELPSRALKAAEKYLARAVNDQGTQRAKRLQNQLDVYLVLSQLRLSWAPSSPGHCWVPSPNFLPARDMIRAGQFDAGLQQLRREADRPYYIQMVWQMASFFQKDPKYQGEYEKLLDEIESSLVEPTDELGRVGQSQLSLRPLVHLVREQSWAVLTVPRDNLLYPRAMLEPMKAYYWWFRQMGGERPMAKQGFEEIRDQIKPKFPDNDLVKIYTGQKVPWGDGGLRPDDDQAPQWAVDQVELRRRADYVGEWWFTQRQQKNGELGGGWEDDCESLRRFAVTPLLCGNEKIESGIFRLIDGIWESGELVNGYDRVLKDVEHSCEMAADSSILLALAYGDPLYVERMLETTRTTEQIHTAINDRGHRHYRSNLLSATEVREEDSHSFDVLFAGRAMRPPAMLAWYTHLPRAVDLVVGWARGWNDAALRQADGKPAGVYPAVIRFPDAQLKGPRTWWEGLGGLYSWNTHDQDMVLGKVLGAYGLQQDEALLEAIRQQFTLARKHSSDSGENPEPGSIGWTAGQVRASAPRFSLWYRAVTGDPCFDDFSAAHSAYGRFVTDGDLQHLDQWHDRNLAEIRFNLPMITSEVRGTDRISMDHFSLVGPLSGSYVDLVQPPMYPVSWKVGEDFAGVVGSFDERRVKAWAYSFADQTTRCVIRLWRLEPGQYELRIGADPDQDGKVDEQHVTIVPFERRQRLTEVAFDLPSRDLQHLEVVQRRKGPDLPMHLPDLAVMPRDVQLDEDPVVGKPVAGRVVVHNIGSADADDVTVRIEALVDKEMPYEIAKIDLGSLSYPADLIARRVPAAFTWIPKHARSYTLRVEVKTMSGDLEIYDGNNRAVCQVVVAGS